METRRSSRLSVKENCKNTSAFKERKQNCSNDKSRKNLREGSTSPVPNKKVKSSYFDPDFSDESSSDSDSPPAKRRAPPKPTPRRLPKRNKNREDSKSEGSSEEFIKKPKSVTDILKSKSELKLSSDESDSSDESPSKRKKKSECSPAKKKSTSIKVEADDSSDEFVKPKSLISTSNTIKSESSEEPDISEENQSSQAEYFDFTALVNKVKANETNSNASEEVKVEAECKKPEPSTSKKPKKIAVKKENKSEPNPDLEVFELLAMGEDTDMSAKDIKESVAQSSQEYEIPKQVEVLLDGPVVKKKKPTDLEMTLRRRLNFIRRENQVYVHKVHILCWISHGMYVNSVLNSPELLSLALSLLPSDKCYPAKRMDMEYLGKLIEWFVKKIKLKNEHSQNAIIKLPASLETQFQKLEAQSKNDLCFMFICIMRALGIKCRLVVNLNVAPIKPTSDQLLPINPKKNDTAESSTLKLLQKSKECSKSTSNGALKPQPGTSKSGKESKPSSKTEKKPEKTPKKDNSSRTESTSRSNSRNKSETPKKTESPKERSSRSKSDKPEDIPKRSSRSQSAKSTIDKNDKRSNSPESKKSTEKEPPRRSARSKSSSTKDQSKYFAEERTTRKSERITNSNYFPKQTEDPKSKKSKESRSDKSGSKKSKNDQNKGNKKKEPENLVEEMSTSDDSDEDDATFVQSKKKKIDRRVLSSEEDTQVEEKSETKIKQNKLNYWLEVFLEAEEQWISVDIVKKSYHCVQQLYNQTSHPVRYIIAFNSDQTLKDVTRRYVPQYLSVTRKLRVDDTWWNSTLSPFKPPQDAQNREEDEALDKVLEEQPLPTAISEYKSHPLYALKRHLLKFQAIYPPDAPPLGYVKGEPVYSRLCVQQLHGREMWIKEAKVVKIGEKPYKIVKGRQKKDKFGTDEGPKDLELFGLWQTEDYDPPIAENGIVPRNSFGNVELFKPCMLPKGTVYLQIPGLQRIANKLNIDCAAAITGFEYSTNGWSYPVKDGFVVCEEYKDILLDAYNQEVEEAEKKEKQKREERVYANWKRLIKGLYIRERLKRKYNFGDPGTSSEQSQQKELKSK